METTETTTQSRRRSARNGLPTPALAYLIAVAIATVASAIPALAQLHTGTDAWLTFAVLGACAAAAQFFVVPTGSNHGFHTAIVFTIAGALLLPPGLVALFGVAQHLPDGLKKRYPWYIQTFNVCNYSLSGLGAWSASWLMRHAGVNSAGLRTATAGIAAVVAWVLLNHFLLAAMLRLARGRTIRSTGLFSARTISTDLVVGAFGIAFAALWSTNAWLIPALLAPLALAHRSFSNLASMRESERRFRAMFESAAVGAALIDLEQHVVATNRALEDMLGYTKDEFAYRPSADVVHPEERAEDELLLRELLAGKREEFRAERRYVARSGSVLYGTVAAALVRDADDRPQFAICMVEDVTERRQAAEALRESEQRYRGLFENANDMVFVLDPMGAFSDVNRRAAEITGFSVEELVGGSIVDLLVADSQATAQAHVGATLAGRTTGTFDCELVARNGRRVLLEVALTPIRNGSIIGVQGIARDVSERKELEERLRQAQKMEAVGRLAGGVAHDFNNLLTAISGYTEFALQALDEGTAVARNDVEEIRKAADRASSLTRQLLAFSRKQLLKPKVVDVNEIVRDTEKMLTRLIGENIEVETVLGTELGSVKADPGQLEQVIVNLVVNARDAMPDGGTVKIETTEVEVENYHSRGSAGPIPPGPYVVLSVHDDGFGFDDETKGRLFEPFFTTKEQGKGTGLGLATVYGIVKQSDGYITVESEPGRGASFSIYLRKLTPAAATPATEDGVAGTAPPGSETVLLVEDEEIVRRLVRAILERNGYTVLEARDGREALEIGGANSEPIHLLLTDVVMPKMGGAELADRLIELHTETKVLFMSGYTGNAVVSDGRLRPGTEIIQKPFRSDVLAQKIREVLDGDAPGAPVESAA